METRRSEVKNEWLVIYLDEFNEEIIMPFNTYESAQNFSKIVPVFLGVVRSQWYNDNVHEVGFEFGSIIEQPNLKIQTHIRYH